MVPNIRTVDQAQAELHSFKVKNLNVYIRPLFTNPVTCYHAFNLIIEYVFCYVLHTLEVILFFISHISKLKQFPCSNQKSSRCNLMCLKTNTFLSKHALQYKINMTLTEKYPLGYEPSMPPCSATLHVTIFLLLYYIKLVSHLSVCLTVRLTAQPCVHRSKRDFLPMKAECFVTIKYFLKVYMYDYSFTRVCKV